MGTDRAALRSIGDRRHLQALADRCRRQPPEQVVRAISRDDLPRLAAHAGYAGGPGDTGRQREYLIQWLRQNKNQARGLNARKYKARKFKAQSDDPALTTRNKLLREMEGGQPVDEVIHAIPLDKLLLVALRFDYTGRQTDRAQIEAFVRRHLTKEMRQRKSARRRPRGSGSVWTTSGGLPTLGRRR